MTAALRLAEEGEVFRAVPVPVPALDGGPDAELRADFRWLPADRARAAMEAGDLEFLRAVLAGWEGVERPDGRPLDYCEASIDALAGAPHVVAAVSRAYSAWLRGAAGKNLVA